MNLIVMDNDLHTVEDSSESIYGSVIELYSLLVKKTREYVDEDDDKKKLKKEREMREIRKNLKTLSKIAPQIHFRKKVRQ